MTRYTGWYANRVRGRRRRTGTSDGTAVVVAPREHVPLPGARRRWAELLRRIYKRWTRSPVHNARGRGRDVGEPVRSDPRFQELLAELCL